MPPELETNPSDKGMYQRGNFKGKNEECTQDNLKQKSANIASQFHDEWRQSRWRKKTEIMNRVKRTNDHEWSKKNNGDTEVDIANTSYEDLPSDWQAENKASAEVAITEVEAAIRDGRELDNAFIKEVSSTLHDKWLERNGRWAPPEQNKPYAELTDEEKEKDRVIIRKAIEAVKKLS
ncbi:hypothetical protein EPN15_01385 [Patescibacteria group bacterium]|nr:MAG: hypothetical protein EPN15_01385 [Patescibacteria group bacterium]